MTDRETFAPLVFFEYDHAPGTYCLMLPDAAMGGVAGVFEEAGHECNGYAWEGVARSAMRTRAPEMADLVKYDPEAGMFIAYGADPAALQTLGALLREAMGDRALLKGFIETGDPAWFD
ncbi:immunity 51 family protein [Streptomyces sp. NPDC005551]|uniref:immunity 51 family protein n=1 Tax=unclassified Streptomyces TaxID=2593676 RepID=UPI00340985C8